MDSRVGRGVADDGLLVVEIDHYQGPLDLLLHLIHSQDIDIFDIPVAAITARFLEAISALPAADIDEAGSFLEIAAMLVRIKARMLLPAPPGETDHDPRTELVRRLLEYEQVREVAARLRGAEADRARRFARGFVERRPSPRPADLPLDTHWDDLFAAALRLEANAPEEAPREHRVPVQPVSMREKVELIRAAVEGTDRVEFAALVSPWSDRAHGVMTLLAGLELGRRRFLALRQREPFAPLWLYRRARRPDRSFEPSPEGTHE